MQTNFNFKNFEASEHLCKYATRRFEKLLKFIHHPEQAEVQISMSLENHLHKADITLMAEGTTFSASEKTTDMYATIDLAYDKLSVQVRKNNDKNKAKRREERKEYHAALERNMPYNEELAEEMEGFDADNLHVTSITPKPMDIEEAVLQLTSLHLEFFVFLNADNKRVNVIYRQKNGDYELIDLI